MSSASTVWASLRDDDGDFSAVGAALDDLGSADAKVRKRALSRIGDRVVHQGGFVSVAAAPLVDALLAHVRQGGGAGHRSEALYLAIDAAVGGHFNHLQAPIGRSVLWPAVAAADARRALAGAYDDLTASLRDDDADVRMAAVLALAFVPERAEATIATIDAALAKERSAVVRTMELLVLGLLGAAHPARVAPPLSRGLGKKGTERFVAAIAWLFSQPGALDDAEKTDLVLEATSAPPDKKLPILRGDFSRLAVGALGSALALDGRSSVARALAERAAGTPAEGPVLSAWLDGHVPAPRPQLRFPKLPSELGPETLEVLRYVATAVFERPEVDRNLILAYRGVFDLPDDLARFVGLAPAGPLDDVVGGRPLWAWALAARDDEAAMPAMEAALRGRDVLAVVKDLATAPYRLDTQWPPTHRGNRDAALARLGGRLLRAAPADAVGAWLAEVAAGPRHPARPAALAKWLVPQLVLEAVLARTDVVPETAHIEALIGTTEAARNTDLHARALARFPR